MVQSHPSTSFGRDDRAMNSTVEWSRAAKAKIKYADEDLRKALQTRHESCYARNATEKATQARQLQVNENLKQKAKDTASVRAKLENELEAVNVELAMLFDERDRLKDLLHKQKAPLKINLQCIEIRSQRPETENIRDEVQKELKQQKRELEGTYNVLRKILVRVDEQIQKLDDIKLKLRDDIASKGDSLSLDMQCLSLPSPDDLEGAMPELTSQPSSRLNSDWRVKTFELCHSANEVRLESGKIRAKGAATWKHRFEVDRAVRGRLVDCLRHKLNQTRMQRGKIEDRLIESSKEITEAERARGDLRQSLSDKEEPFQLACGRLRMRDKRPSTEKVRDAAERALEAELGSLNESIVQLRDKKDEVTDEIELLKRMKQELEADCNAKNKALHLDTLCLRLQLQAKRGGAAGDLGDIRNSARSGGNDGSKSVRSQRSGFGETRSQYGDTRSLYEDSARPSTAGSIKSDRSAMSMKSSGSQRHRDIMRQMGASQPLKPGGKGGATPRPPTAASVMSGMSMPSTARSQGSSTARSQGPKKSHVW